MHKSETRIRPNILDLLKILAIILMIIDHVGYFMLPEYSSLRLIGRFSFPLFFIIIGLHLSYRVRRDLIMMSLVIQIILSIYRYATGSHERYLSILANVILVKVILDQISVPLQNNNYHHRILSCIALIATSIIPRTAARIEYGSASISLGILGYLIASRASTQIIGLNLIISVVGSIMINGHFHFLPQERGILVTGLSIMLSTIRVGYQHLYTPVDTNKNTKNLIQQTSQYALYIYVIHIPIILAIARLIRI